MLDIIKIDGDLKKAFCNRNNRFDICMQIPLTYEKKLEELYPHPGVYIFHGENREILYICKSKNHIGNSFGKKFGPKSNWMDNGIERKPISVSAIILNENSAKYAGEIKKKLKEWFKPIFR